MDCCCIVCGGADGRRADQITRHVHDTFNYNRYFPASAHTSFVLSRFFSGLRVRVGRD